jgi:ATP-dependent helicase HrpB
VPGVTAVIDAGLQKVARYDADRGIDSLETERITTDAADQRAGRAGRLAPGVVRRLWDVRDRLRPHREPEIHRVDLAGTALDVIAWGGDPRTFEWFERPREDALSAAIALLERLGLIAVRNPQSATGHTVHLTAMGEQVRRVPLHPRLARILVESGGARQIAQACALLSERHLLPPRTATTASDLLSALDQWGAVPPHVKRAAEAIVDLGSRFRTESTIRSAVRDPQSAMPEDAFRRAILSGYPDRVAQRREPGSASLLLASGTGAVMAAESGVRDGEFLVALDVSRTPLSDSLSNRHFHPQSAVRDPQFARVRLASLVEREWLTPTVSELVHRFDVESGKVRAAIVDRYDALSLVERPVPADPEIAAGLLAGAWLARGPRDEDTRLLRRLRFAGHDVDLEVLVRTAAYGARTLNDVRIDRALAPDVARAVDRDAPESLAVPSGRQAPLEYHDGGGVSASVKLQELFGLAETPRVGRQREAVVLSLLAPNGRPVQVTRDLRSFWDRTYPEVRKALRGRYPRHPWPEDPWTAAPSARTKNPRRRTKN